MKQHIQICKESARYFLLYCMDIGQSQYIQKNCCHSEMKKAINLKIKLDLHFVSWYLWNISKFEKKWQYTFWVIALTMVKLSIFATKMAATWKRKKEIFLKVKLYLHFSIWNNTSKFEKNLPNTLQVIAQIMFGNSLDARRSTFPNK